MQKKKEEVNLNISLTPFTKSEDHRYKTQKYQIPQVNIVENLNNLGDTFLDRAPKIQPIKERINKLDIIKM